MPFSEHLADNLAVVLVRTLEPGNLGSVARAMMNMGVRRLKLVSPCPVDTQESRKMAGKAAGLLARAEIYAELQEALAEEHLVIGTTSTRERKARPVTTPRRIATLARSAMSGRRLALVFGSERSGLSEEELARCSHLVSIPASPEHPVLNLAQSVLILLYEICSAEEVLPHPRLLASDRMRGEMFEQMQRVLVEIGFLPAHNPQHIMSTLRNLLGRAALDEREVRILRGIFSQMEWFIQEGRRRSPEQVRKR